MKMMPAVPTQEPVAPQPEIRPAFQEAMEDKLRELRERQSEIVQRMTSTNPHNPAQQPIRRPAEPGRNSLCPCSSGVKYKRCCANAPAQTLQRAA
jgi:uncharacterized protein YecA (UPF0149 family)